MAKSKEDNYNVLFQKIELIEIIRIDKVCEHYKKFNEINLMLGKCITQLQKNSSEKTIDLKKCITISEEIDQVIILLGQLTQEVEHEQPLNYKNIINELGLLKEKAWSLLEALDEFCEKEFNFSIW